MHGLSRTRFTGPFVVILASSHFVIACADEGTYLPSPHENRNCPALPVDPENPAISYDREDVVAGPSAWGKLLNAKGEVAYPGCANTMEQQSPIALPSPEMPWATGGMYLSPAVLSWSRQAEVTSIINNGRTWLTAIAPTPANTIQFRGELYELQQFHVHTPGEHSIGGMSFPMELHLVHRGGSRAFAVVVAVMIEESAEDHPEFAKLWSRFSECPEAAPTMLENVTVDVASFLPANTAHFEYDGSLSTPPCTRVTHWIVMTEPIFASPAQIARFKDSLGQTNRPAQPIIDEQLVTYEAPKDAHWQ